MNVNYAKLLPCAIISISLIISTLFICITINKIYTPKRYEFTTRENILILSDTNNGIAYIYSSSGFTKLNFLTQEKTKLDK